MGGGGIGVWGSLLWCTGSLQPPPSDALDWKGPQRWPQGPLDRRLEEAAEAVGGGYWRLQMPLRLALGVRETAAGHRLGALEGGGWGPPPLSNAALPPPDGQHKALLALSPAVCGASPSLPRPLRRNTRDAAGDAQDRAVRCCALGGVLGCASGVAMMLALFSMYGRI